MLRKVLYLVLALTLVVGAIGMPTSTVSAGSKTNPGIFWAHNFCNQNHPPIDWDILELILQSIIDGSSNVTYFADGLRVIANGVHYKLPYMTAADDVLGTIFDVAKTHKWGGALTGNALKAKQAIMQSVAKLWKNAKPTTLQNWQDAIDGERSNYSNSHCPEKKRVVVPKWIPVPVAVPKPEPNRIIPNLYTVLSDGSVIRGYNTQGVTILTTYSLSQKQIDDIIKVTLGTAIVAGTVYLIVQSGGTLTPIVIPAASMMLTK
jgi:hypothetical protein